MLADSAAFRELETGWLNHSPSLRDAMLKVLKESEAKSFKLLKEAQASLFKRLEGQSKLFENEQIVFLKHLGAREKRLEKKAEELSLQNYHLIVGLSLFRLSTDFLIFQQDAVLEGRTRWMKLEGKYNVRGALGM